MGVIVGVQVGVRVGVRVGVIVGVQVGVTVGVQVGVRVGRIGWSKGGCGGRGTDRAEAGKLELLESGHFIFVYR